MNKVLLITLATVCVSMSAQTGQEEHCTHLHTPPDTTAFFNNLDNEIKEAVVLGKMRHEGFVKQKTIKQVKGMPATDGHSVEITYHNGLVYFAPFGENAAGIFTYNPQTEQVAQVLTWNNNIAYIHFFE